MNKPLSNIMGYEEVIGCRWFGKWHFYTDYWKKIHKTFTNDEINILMLDCADKKLNKKYDKRKKEMGLEYGN